MFSAMGITTLNSIQDLGLSSWLLFFPFIARWIESLLVFTAYNTIVSCDFHGTLPCCKMSKNQYEIIWYKEICHVVDFLMTSTLSFSDVWVKICFLKSIDIFCSSCHSNFECCQGAVNHFQLTKNDRSVGHHSEKPIQTLLKAELKEV